MDLYIHSSIRLHGVVLNLLSTETTLPLPLKQIVTTGLPRVGERRQTNGTHQEKPRIQLSLDS
jgi:hypothetical protein